MFEESPKKWDVSVSKNILYEGEMAVLGNYMNEGGAYVWPSVLNTA